MGFFPFRFLHEDMALTGESQPGCNRMNIESLLYTQILKEVPVSSVLLEVWSEPEVEVVEGLGKQLRTGKFV